MKIFIFFIYYWVLYNNIKKYTISIKIFKNVLRRNHYFQIEIVFFFIYYWVLYNNIKKYTISIKIFKNVLRRNHYFHFWMNFNEQKETILKLLKFETLVKILKLIFNDSCFRIYPLSSRCRGS